MAVSLSVSAETPEELAKDSLELASFISELGYEGMFDTLEELADSDQNLVRVLEDLINVLIDRDIIHFTDLPAAAQTKLLARQSMRKALNPLRLLDEPDQGLI